MSRIKQRRRTMALPIYPGLCVGDCVPFYFCPRSVMLYVIHRANLDEFLYSEGQEPIVHLQADLIQAVNWTETNRQRWAFTSRNAGAYYVSHYCNLAELEKINWAAVNARDWRGCTDHKQAEFLVEQKFAWELVSYIGVLSRHTYNEVTTALRYAAHKPPVGIQPAWYY